MARGGSVAVLLLALAASSIEVSAVSRDGGALPGLEALDTGNLKSIAAWLKLSGREGFLAADVADAAGIPRDAAETALDARQRGFKSDNVLRIAQVPSDAKRDFLLFMVQRPDGEVYFYLSTVREGLKKAFVYLPLKDAVAALDPEEAQANFRREVLFWQDRAAGADSAAP
jgi:hypothetical protein